MQEVLTIKEAAERSRLSQSAIRGLIDSGDILSRKVGPRRGRVQVFTDSLDDYLERCKVVKFPTEKPKRRLGSPYSQLEKFGYRPQ